MRFRSKDIAKELGVSPATVSLVINGKPGVGDELRDKVLKKIKEKNCEHLVKGDLKGKGSIGFVICKCKGPIIDEFPFFGYLIEGINKTIQKYNYQMNMIHLDANMSEAEKLHIIENANCKGYIIYAVEMYEKDLKIFEGLKEPSVFLDNTFRMSEVDSIAIDNYLGVSQAIEHLYQMGHKKIGYIQSKVGISSFEDRFDAFKKSLEKYDMSYNEEYIMRVGYLEAETRNDVIDYLGSAKDLPTAFFADNDLLACRAISGMKEVGYNVPEDISVVGFDDRAICTFTEPPVTTIAIPRNDMGSSAVDLLVSSVEYKRKYRLKVLVGTRLIERGSVSKRM